MTLEEKMKSLEEVIDANMFLAWKDPKYKESAEWKRCVEENECLLKWLSDYKKLLGAIEDIKEKAELDENYCVEVGQVKIATAFREIIDICKHTIRKKDV